MCSLALALLNNDPFPQRISTEKPRGRNTPNEGLEQTDMLVVVKRVPLAGYSRSRFFLFFNEKYLTPSPH